MAGPGKGVRRCREPPSLGLLPGIIRVQRAKTYLAQSFKLWLAPLLFILWLHIMWQCVDPCAALGQGVVRGRGLAPCLPQGHPRPQDLSRPLFLRSEPPPHSSLLGTEAMAQGPWGMCQAQTVAEGGAP